VFRLAAPAGIGWLEKILEFQVLPVLEVLLEMALLLHSAWFRSCSAGSTSSCNRLVGWKNLEFQVLQLVEGLYLPVDLRGYSEESGKRLPVTRL